MSSVNLIPFCITSNEATGLSTITNLSWVTTRRKSFSPNTKRTNHLEMLDFKAVKVLFLIVRILGTKYFYTN